MSDDDIPGRPIAESIPPLGRLAANEQLPSPARLMWWGVWIEGGCLLAAIILGAFGFYDRHQPLHDFFRLDLATTLAWTLFGLLATFAVAGAIMFIPIRPFREFREFVNRFLIPVFEPLSLVQIALLSGSAGLGEEMLFRWCLQGGLQTACGGIFGTIGALCLASVVFGLCHAMGAMYIVLASLIGGLLGIVMLLSGSVVPAILAHGIYDFVAILILRQSGRAKAGRARASDRTPE